MSKNIVFEGWLTKSPPTKRIWRTKWRRRWFALRQSGDLPGQYFLDYYADRNRRRLKGTINLDLCEQVDAGLHMESDTHGSLDPKLRGSVFTIQTQLRTYHLEADCEADMAKWVDAICRVCGLRSTEEDSPDVLVTYQSNSPAVAISNEEYQCATGKSPYIPISECITGVRSQDTKSTFNSRKIVINTKTPFERSARRQQIYMSQPYIRPPTNMAEFSENDSNLSEDESKSLNASQSNIRNWSASKSFTKANPGYANQFVDNGPPVPPRPPKTFAMSKDLTQRDRSPSPRFVQPVDVPVRTRELEASMQYCNLSLIPPIVDRNLKPRRVTHTLAEMERVLTGRVNRPSQQPPKSEVLQYLDLDLDALKSDKPVTRKGHGNNHSKSMSADGNETNYKTVDFLKTEAFNITRQDAEASRSNQQ